MNEWFIANKVVSLNTRKTKNIFFYKQSARDMIPLKLFTITFNNIKIKRECFINFFGVIINENITWNNHIELVENKISENICTLYKALYYLDKKTLTNIYFSFIPNYVNCCNIAWVSTIRTKLDKVLKKQKNAVRMIYNKDKFTHSKLLMKDMNALNIYQINIFQGLKFMYIAKHYLNPTVLDNMCKKIHHRYPTRFPRSNFKHSKIITKVTSLYISFRWSKILKNYLHESDQRFCLYIYFLINCWNLKTDYLFADKANCT